MNTKRLTHKCGTPLKRSDRHDAYYCPKCNVWTERGCGRVRCEYCRNRPKKPLNDSAGK